MSLILILPSGLHKRFQQITDLAEVSVESLSQPAAGGSGDGEAERVGSE